MSTTELDRVLDTLLHDLRSPLGAASGYARLLRQGRVTDPAEVDRVLARMQEALGAMSTLCADVSTWRDPEPVARPHHVTADGFAAMVADRLRHIGLPLHRATNECKLTLLDDPDRVAPAVATVLATVARARTTRLSIAIQVADGVLRFDAHDPAADPAVTPFDPWQYGGLQVPLACRTIGLAGGRCPTAAPGDAAVSITFAIDEPDDDR